MNRFQSLFIFVFIPFFTLATEVNDIKAQSVNLGIKGGGNISSHLKNFRYPIDGTFLDFSPKVTLGYQAGFIIQKDFNSPLRLQAEPSIIRMGARYEEPFSLRGFDFQTDSRTSLLYVQLPLLLQLSTVPPQRTVYGRPFATTTYHLSGGIFGGYLLDARFSGTNTGAPAGIDFEGEFTNDIRPQYSELDGGIIIGAGFEHGHSKKIGFETRLLFSIFDSGNAPEIFFKPQNMGVTFSVYLLL